MLSTIVTMLYIRYSEYIHVATENFYPFKPIYPALSPLQPEKDKYCMVSQVKILKKRKTKLTD